jgi:hypothetical protein
MAAAPARASLPRSKRRYCRLRRQYLHFDERRATEAGTARPRPRPKVGMRRGRDRRCVRAPLSLPARQPAQAHRSARRGRCRQRSARRRRRPQRSARRPRCPQRSARRRRPDRSARAARPVHAGVAMRSAPWSLPGWLAPTLPASRTQQLRVGCPARRSVPVRRRRPIAVHQSGHASSTDPTPPEATAIVRVRRLLWWVGRPSAIRVLWGPSPGASRARLDRTAPAARRASRAPPPSPGSHPPWREPAAQARARRLVRPRPPRWQRAPPAPGAPRHARAAPRPPERACSSGRAANQWRRWMPRRPAQVALAGRDLDRTPAPAPPGPMTQRRHPGTPRRAPAQEQMPPPTAVRIRAA